MRRVTMLNIELQYECEATNPPSEQDFQTWSEAALKDNKYTELVIRLVTAEESSELNNDYRGKDYPTNVLSFADEEIPGFPATSLGTLVICPEVMTKESSDMAIEIMDHWAHLVVHGTLHLQGYDHENDADAEEMESEEVKILAKLGINNPYEQ